MARVLLLGGAGFLGNYVAKSLCMQNVDFAIVDHCAVDDPISPRPYRAGHPKVHVAKYEKYIDKIVDSGSTHIIHLAAMSLRQTLYGSSDLAFEANARGVLQLIDRLIKNEWGGRFIYVSSSEVYGNAKMPLGGYKEDSKKEPVTPYAIAKYAAERNVLYAARHCGLDAIVVRPFNLFGPYAHYEDLNGEVIPRFSIMAARDCKLPIYSETKRDFLWAPDAAEGIIKAMVYGESGEDYNLATGVSTSIVKVANMITSILKRGTWSVINHKRRGDTIQLKGNYKKAKKKLGWKPTMSLNGGLLHYLRWLITNKHSIDAMLERVY